LNQELKNRALRLLARREHSRSELARKLAAHAGTEEIATLLDQLQQSRLLSDARYAEAVVSARGQRFGPARLRHALHTKGVAEEVVEAALGASEAGEVEQARAVWRRKFPLPPADRNEYARQARFLQGRGFSMAAIRRVLKETGE
jgi:regulatory protein